MIREILATADALPISSIHKQWHVKSDLDSAHAQHEGVIYEEFNQDTEEFTPTRRLVNQNAGSPSNASNVTVRLGTLQHPIAKLASPIPVSKKRGRVADKDKRSTARGKGQEK